MPPDPHGPDSLTGLIADVKEIKIALLGSMGPGGVEGGALHRISVLEAESRFRGKVLWLLGGLVAALVLNNGYTGILRAITPVPATTSTVTNNNAAPLGGKP